MPLFYGGAVPMYRQLKGLLLSGRPEGRYKPGRRGGKMATGIARKLWTVRDLLTA